MFVIFRVAWLSVDRPEEEHVSQQGHVAPQRPGQDISLKSSFKRLELLKDKKNLNNYQTQLFRPFLGNREEDWSAIESEYIGDRRIEMIW